MCAMKLMSALPLTIDIKTVSVQHEGPQPGDTVGFMAQLSVQLLSVQPSAWGLRVVGADGIYSGG